MVFGNKDSNNIYRTQVPFTPPMSKTPARACDGQVRVRYRGVWGMSDPLYVFDIVFKEEEVRLYRKSWC
jgi:hypothetical protein